MSQGQFHQNVQWHSARIESETSEKVALQEFSFLNCSKVQSLTIINVTRKSFPKSRCIGKKCLVTKGNTPSSWQREVPSEQDD